MFLLSKLSTDFAIEDSILVPFIDRAPHLRFQLEESTQKTEPFGVAMFLIVIGSTRQTSRLDLQLTLIETPVPSVLLFQLVRKLNNTDYANLKADWLENGT